MKLLDTFASHLCFRRFMIHRVQQEYKIEVQNRPDMSVGPYIGVILREDKHTNVCFVLIPFASPLDSIYQYTHKSKMVPI
jgi:hypothetical protein